MCDASEPKLADRNAIVIGYRVDKPKPANKAQVAIPENRSRKNQQQDARTGQQKA
jgi:hypothetical protein